MYLKINHNGQQRMLLGIRSIEITNQEVNERLVPNGPLLNTIFHKREHVCQSNSVFLD